MSDLVSPIKNVLRPLVRPIQQQLSSMKNQRQLKSVIRTIEDAYVDPRIKYPSYKDFDEFIDIAALKSLDGYIRERLAKRGVDSEFWTGPYTPNRTDNQNPGSSVVWLTERTAEEHDYFHLDQPDLWRLAEGADEFAEVMAFVRTLPFKSTGRIMIMYDFNGRAVTAHRDHYKTDLCSEFIWFRTNFVKPFYMMDSVTRERKYVKGHSAWFDTVNQFHGADAADGLSISLRVDGKFTDEFRARIPSPDQNPASTASYWATLSGEA
jgi:hypothetical protein